MRSTPATAAHYIYAYQRLGQYLFTQKELQRADRWTPLVADQYAAWLNETGVKPITTRHNMVCRLALFIWAAQQDYLKKNPLEWYHRPEGKAAMVTGFTPPEIDGLVKACPDTAAGRRNLAILCLILDTGLRRAELAAPKVGDVDIGGHSVMVRHGKGDRARVAVFSEATSTVLRRYLLRHHPDNENADAPLFLGRGGLGLSKYGVTVMVQTLAAKAGIDKERLGPHLLRHSCGEQSIINGLSARAVMALLGHKQLAMAERYTMVEAQEIRSLRESTSPVARLKGIRFRYGNGEGHENGSSLW